MHDGILKAPISLPHLVPSHGSTPEQLLFSKNLHSFHLSAHGLLISAKKSCNVREDDF